MLYTSIPSPDWTGFSVGPLYVHAYALCILLGMIVAVWVTGVRLKHRGMDGGVVIDIALWAIPLGIVGARLYHVLTHPGDFFYKGADLMEIFRIWNGGIAIFGALIFGALGVWIGTRIAGIRFWTFADAAAPGLLLAQAIGRWGNWFNQELFGTPTDLPWGLQIDSGNAAIPNGFGDDVLYHPTFLYESLWNVLGALVLIWAGRRFRLQWGRLFGLYLVWYAIGRILMENLRLDPIDLFLGIRINQFASWIVLFLGLAIMVVQGRRHPGQEPSPFRPGREPHVESTDTVEEGSADEADVDSTSSEVPANDGSTTPTAS